MPGVVKNSQSHRWIFPASRYDDPRGGRLQALEKNILRYRSTEQILYLHYAQETRDYMLQTFDPVNTRDFTIVAWVTGEERRLSQLHSRIIFDAEMAGTVTREDSDKLREGYSEGQQGKKLRTCFANAVGKGAFTAKEADELQALLDYRNDLAHRVHLITADISRERFASEPYEVSRRKYKSDALDRLRFYRKSLWKRTSIQYYLPFEEMLFDGAEKFYEGELKRLSRLIDAQIKKENARLAKISPELDLRGTEFVGDLHPTFPPNRHMNGEGGPDSGHLTKRGIEICYRLYDAGKTPIAVAYLMGMSLRAAQRRLKGWDRAGGRSRVREEVRRYDVSPRNVETTKIPEETDQ